MSALLALAPAASAQDPIPDPSANRNLSAATGQACTAPTSQACVTDALADINAARAAEGFVPMVLPGDWSSLTIPQQLLVLANLERVDRGLPPYGGLTASLNADAQTAANGDTDPALPPGYGAASNWEGGYTSPLLSDFGWMYDDGPGSPNIDCTKADTADCWGHRHDTLEDFPEPLAMGAAYAPSTPDGPSEAEVFVGGYADPPIAPTWATIAATLPVGVSPSSVSLARGARTAQLTVWASGEAMNVTAAASKNWSVAPGGCQLNAGRACTLTVTAASAAPGAGTLTVTGPNGSQSVPLTGPTVTPKLTVTLNHLKIRRGHSARLTGTVTPGEPGTFVELQQRHGHSWRNVARVELRVGNHFSFTVRGRSKGRISYRVSVAASAGFRSATSQTVTLTVR